MMIETNVIIENLSHDGRGIATVGNKTTFIRGALPGEIVNVQITKKHSRYNEGIATEIMQPSSKRVEACCPHFNTCGGCSFQHLDTHAQIFHKQAILMEQLKHFGSVIPKIILSPLRSQPFGYRRKARLGVRYVAKKEKTLVGFREYNNRFLADLTRCKILHPHVGTKLKEVANLIDQFQTPQDIAQIEVAMGDDECALVFRNMRPITQADEKLLIDFAQNHQFTIYLQPGKPYALQKLWPSDNNHLLMYTLADYDLRLKFHPMDFTQINHDMNRQMVSQALTLLDPQPDETILDLFCGLGNFSLPLAKHALHVTGIEGSERMVQQAISNAQLNHLNNIEFHCADLSVALPKAEWVHKTYAKILLDPPRSGAEALIADLARFNAEKIVYVSCNPATLARDAGLLAKKGYHLNKVGVMDMFPHTSHVESIALFIRQA